MHKAYAYKVRNCNHNRFICSGIILCWDLAYLLIYSQCGEAALLSASLDFIWICECTDRLGNALFVFQYTIFVHCLAFYTTACPGIHATRGVLMRTLQLNPRRRRKYSVRAPNSLWHIDGKHKLIRYLKNVNLKIVICVNTVWQWLKGLRLPHCAPSIDVNISKLKLVSSTV